jgi:hypothetical protein
VTAVAKLELSSHLKELRLPSFLRDYARTASDATGESLGYEEYLLRLCSVEVADRGARAFAKRVHYARFPCKKTLADFEFARMPELEPVALHRLAE